MTVTTITKMLSNNKHHYSGYNPCNYITIHETANTAKGATAISHGRYMNNGSTETWHFTVDENTIVQHFDTRVQCWHCGDGMGKGNLSSIGIELCVNSGGNFKKTVDNAIWLVKQLMKQHNISIGNVVQHNKWSGKNCPTNLRNGSKGVTWKHFKEQLKPYTTSASTVKKDVGMLTTKVKLNYYDSPRWNKPNGVTEKGDVFTVVGSKYVQGVKMYKLKSGNWITSSPKYVTFKSK